MTGSGAVGLQRLGMFEAGFSLPAALQEPAPAKLNLYLRVVGRRPDGYHRLDSLAVFAAAGDILTARADPEALTLGLAGPFGAGLATEPDNLVLRAARALASEAGIAPCASLHLDKHLPVASGIGGGSADAAAALRLLSRMWGLSLDPDRLAALALRLGADVPVCLACAPARMEGVGEILSRAPRLPPFGLVLVNPGVAVATADVFRARSAGFSSRPVLPEAWPDLDALAHDLRALGNDLQSPAEQLCPPIVEVLSALAAAPACRFAAMSGSGATCFGLFPSAAAAERAAPALRRPGWWVWGGSPFAPEAVSR